MSKILYDVAQICVNGHVINDSVKKHPEENKKFCEICGEKSITQCPNCRTKIKGAKYSEQEIAVGRDLNSPRKSKGHKEVQKVEIEYKIPAYCPNCGNPYPWTEKKIKAAHELTQELDNLSQKEKELLEKSINDIIKDTPNAKVAATRFKKLAPKIGEVALQGFKVLLVDIISEAMKKMLWP